jgi:hypothetical protein
MDLFTPVVGEEAQHPIFGASGNRPTGSTAMC